MLLILALACVVGAATSVDPSHAQGALTYHTPPPVPHRLRRCPPFGCLWLQLDSLGLTLSAALSCGIIPVRG